LAWAESVLSKKRFGHVMGVQATDLEMSAHYGWSDGPTRQAEIAAIVHDIARESRFDKLIEEAKRLDVPISKWDITIPLVLHARIAPAWLSEKFNLSDPIIAEAIWDHTTGHPEMSVVGKLLYVADKLEAATRDPIWRKPGWQIATDNQPFALDRALLWCLEESIAMVQNSGKPIHPDSFRTHQVISQHLLASQSNFKSISDKVVSCSHAMEGLAT
jgi:predicted HD superfamily hydrolase involved in NAD metabolism